MALTLPKGQNLTWLDLRLLYGGGFGIFFTDVSVEIIHLRYAFYVFFSTIDSQNKVAIWVEKLTLPKTSSCFVFLTSQTKQTTNNLPFAFSYVAFHISSYVHEKPGNIFIIKHRLHSLHFDY